MKSWQSLTLPNGLTLKNRLVKAATSQTMGDAAGNPQPRLASLYRRWARGGVGLIISGNVMVDRTARGEMGNVVLDQQTDLGQLRQWA